MRRTFATESEGTDSGVATGRLRDRGGKGSHRNFVHPKLSKPVTISGMPGDDAKHYQIRAARHAIEESEE